jgi:hypothetical protein
LAAHRRGVRAAKATLVTQGRARARGSRNVGESQSPWSGEALARLQELTQGKGEVGGAAAWRALVAEHFPGRDSQAVRSLAERRGWQERRRGRRRGGRGGVRLGGRRGWAGGSVAADRCGQAGGRGGLGLRTPAAVAEHLCHLRDRQRQRRVDPGSGLTESWLRFGCWIIHAHSGGWSRYWHKQRLQQYYTTAAGQRRQPRRRRRPPVDKDDVEEEGVVVEEKEEEEKEEEEENESGAEERQGWSRSGTENDGREESTSGEEDGWETQAEAAEAAEAERDDAAGAAAPGGADESPHPRPRAPVMGIAIEGAFAPRPAGRAEPLSKEQRRLARRACMGRVPPAVHGHWARAQDGAAAQKPVSDSPLHPLHPLHPPRPTDTSHPTPPN